ncbi:hypothetical protein BIW11_09384 [Tropilaelaps mercedesae]|uniref:Uncharacterized protein n=1 Tax=Tropilaelaps mercedesae TaxID=418985 RepID=A0A1V9XKE1_9ACAR|nr:hypothetical protein BIW11_09384 [Tropilaelaps mercedesae]
MGLVLASCVGALVISRFVKLKPAEF